MYDTSSFEYSFGALEAHRTISEFRNSNFAPERLFFNGRKRSHWPHVGHVTVFEDLILAFSRKVDVGPTSKSLENSFHAKGNSFGPSRFFDFWTSPVMGLVLRVDGRKTKTRGVLYKGFSCFWLCLGCCDVSCACLCMIQVVLSIVSVHWRHIRPFLNFEIQIWLPNGSFLQS